MKQTIRLFYCLMIALSHDVYAVAQPSAGALSVALSTYIDPLVEEKAAGATAVLENKLKQIIAANGFSDNLSRFVIAANMTVVTKDVLGTAPATFAYTVDLVLAIGDGTEGKKYASHFMTLKGVGTNPSKALIHALRNVKADDSAIQAFVAKGREQIMQYYNSRCDQFIKEVTLLGQQNHFDEALYRLMTVPDESSCYTNALAAAERIYDQKIQRDGKIKLLEAQNHWSANPNREGANQVARILKGIDPRSPNYSDVAAFANTVGRRVVEIDGRAWDFKLDKEIGLERERIQAIRDIGIAWGNAQQSDVIYNVKHWW